MRGGFTFAVVGRDEAATLPHALGRALDAAGARDRTWFVDSGSTDASASIAADLGVEVVPAPVGKGRAMQVALDRAARAHPDGHVVFLDADYEWSERNIPAEVRAGVEATDADLLVGAYDEPARRRVVTPAIYRPFVGALVPEALEPIDVPLSGFRALRPHVAAAAPLPPGYGVETHLNLEAVLGGHRVASWRVGEFRGSLKGYANIDAILCGVADAVLDAAVRHGRLAAEARPAWTAWAAEIRAVIGRQPPPGAPDADFLAELAEAAARPLPAADPTPVAP